MAPTSVKKEIPERDQLAIKVLDKVAAEMAKMVQDPKFNQPPQAQVPQGQSLPPLRTGAPMQMMQFPVGVSSPLDLQTVMSYFQTANAIQNKPLEESMALRRTAQQENSVALDDAAKRHRLEMSNYEAPFLHQKMLMDQAMMKHQAAGTILQNEGYAQGLSDAQRKASWEIADRPLDIEKRQTEVNYLKSQAHRANIDAKYALRNARIDSEYGRLRNEILSQELNQLMNPSIVTDIDGIVKQIVDRETQAQNIYDVEGKAIPQQEGKFKALLDRKLREFVVVNGTFPSEADIEAIVADTQYVSLLGGTALNMGDLGNLKENSGWLPKGTIGKLASLGGDEQLHKYLAADSYFDLGPADISPDALKSFESRLIESRKAGKIQGVAAIPFGPGEYGLVIVSGDGEIYPVRAGERNQVYTEGAENSDLTKRLWAMIPPEYKPGKEPPPKGFFDRAAHWYDAYSVRQDALRESVQRRSKELRDSGSYRGFIPETGRR